MPRMRLMWPRDADGYRIKYRQRHARPPRQSGRQIFVGGEETIAGGGDSEPVLVGKSGHPRDPYDAFGIVGLYYRLADVRDDRTAIDFADKFGLLGTGKTQLVSQSLHAAALIRDLLTAHRDGRPSYIDGWLAEHGDAIRFTANMAGAGFFIRPATLQDAIFAAFFQDAYSGARLKMCERPDCNTWFYYGPGSDPPRRSTVRFCSPRCAQAVAWVRRKERELK